MALVPLTEENLLIYNLADRAGLNEDALRAVMEEGAKTGVVYAVNIPDEEVVEDGSD